MKQDEVQKALDTSRQLNLLLANEIYYLPELENVDEWYLYSMSEVTITMPYNFEMFEQTKQILISNGWNWDKDDSVKPWCGNILTDFYKGVIVNDKAYHLTIHVHIKPDLNGSVCKRQIIGYAKPEPIYEVVCNEMADS